MPVDVIVPPGWPVRLGGQRFLIIVLVVGGWGLGGFVGVNVRFLPAVGDLICILKRSL